jgi:isopentenyl-diphosphate Delta-isomerase
MEYVILVDKNNNEIGTAPKDTVHTKNTPLHRAFSLFLFNSKKQLLITRRAETKKTFPGVWTNSVCGHLGPGETPSNGAKRRLKDELGITGVEVKEVSPYRYRFADKNGIVENEICPILVAYSDINPTINKQEVDDWKWMDWKEFLKEIHTNPDTYSPWSREEAGILLSQKII